VIPPLVSVTIGDVNNSLKEEDRVFDAVGKKYHFYLLN
jgi:hypothetical protein